MSALTGAASQPVVSTETTPNGRPSAGLTDILAGTWYLTRLALRRDRVMAPVWVLVIASFVLSTAASFKQLYPTVEGRLIFARQIEGNAGLTALTGPPFALDSIGGLTAWRISSICGLLAAVMSVLLVVRHTRAEEESNRLELLGSGVVGRFAPLTAAVLTALVTNAALALVIGMGLIGTGLPAAGSIALGLAIAACGVVFAAAAAVTAQLTESARAANGIANALVGAAYLLRAAGDSSGREWLSWLSPIGWAQRARAFGGERWWVLVLIAAVSVGLFAIGYLLVGRRDLGEGLLPSRPGAPHAVWWLRSPFALAWRLQRGALVGWAAGLAVYGAAIGLLAQTVADLVRDNPQLGDMLHKLGGSQQTVVDAYLASQLTFAAIVAASYGVQAALRLAAEENDQRAETLLALPVGRIRWVLGNLVISLGGAAILLAVMGSAIGLVDGARTGDIGGQLPRMLGAAMVQVFAAWVFVGLVIALFGLAPRWAKAAWGAVVGSLFLSLLGPALGLNPWLVDLSPSSHLPAMPGGIVTWTPLAWLLAVTLGLCIAGLVGLQRRDIH